MSYLSSNYFEEIRPDRGETKPTSGYWFQPHRKLKRQNRNRKFIKEQKEG